MEAGDLQSLIKLNANFPPFLHNRGESKRYGHMKLPIHTYQNHTTCSISQACSSKSYVDVSVLQHVLINANHWYLPWYKFHIHKLWGLEDSMVTQIYQCAQNHETQFTSRTHNFKCDGDVTMLKHVLLNLNPCCVHWYKFHVHRGKDTVTQICPFAPKS